MKLSILSIVSLLKLTSGAKNYVLRFDDVQDYYIADSQRAVIQWAMDNNAAISIGIIGGAFGSDNVLVQKISDCLSKGPCEVFNHGWDATNRLGDMDSIEEIQGLISDSHNLIQRILGYTCTVYIPHENSWSELLTQALDNLNYDIISASFDEGMVFNMGLHPVHMPQQTQTAVYGGEDGGWTRTEPEDIYAACEAAVAGGDEACIIMSHPQEFAAGEVSLSDLTAVKNMLDSNGWTSTTFQEAASGFVQSRPTAAPTYSLAPTPPSPPVALFGQCGYTPSKNYGYNCIAGAYCFYGGQYWSSCQPCESSPNVASEKQYEAMCNGSGSVSTSAPVAAPKTSAPARPLPVSTSAPVAAPKTSAPTRLLSVVTEEPTTLSPTSENIFSSVSTTGQPTTAPTLSLIGVPTGAPTAATEEEQTSEPTLSSVETVTKSPATDVPTGSPISSPTESPTRNPSSISYYHTDLSISNARPSYHHESLWGTVVFLLLLGWAV